MNNESTNQKLVLYTASVVKTHIMQFHIPYLKLLKELGYTTYVIAKNDYDNKEDCKIPYCDFYIDMDFARSPFSFKNIKAYSELKKIINSKHFDIIHTHTPTVSILTRLASKKTRKNGTRVYYTAHGFHFFEGAPLKNWFYYPIEKFFSKYVDAILTINKYDYYLAKNKFYCDNVIHIPGIGIDYDRFSKDISDDEVNKMKNSLGISSDKFVLISIGELQEIKNHRIIIEALHKLNNPNIIYLLVGQGELYSEYKNLINQYNLAKNIKMLGYRKDTDLLLKCSNVIIHPSKREGLGLAPLEGMASGLPLIGSYLGGMKDFVVNDVTGISIDPYNLDDMVNAINTLFNNKDLCIKYGNNNKEIAKKYSIDESIKIVRKLYE